MMIAEGAANNMSDSKDGDDDSIKNCKYGQSDVEKCGHPISASTYSGAILYVWEAACCL